MRSGLRIILALALYFTAVPAWCQQQGGSDNALGSAMRGTLAQVFGPPANDAPDRDTTESQSPPLSDAWDGDSSSAEGEPTDSSADE